jgi:hypothetical protein
MQMEPSKPAFEFAFDFIGETYRAEKYIRPTINHGIPCFKIHLPLVVEAEGGHLFRPSGDQATPELFGQAIVRLLRCTRSVALSRGAARKQGAAAELIIALAVECRGKFGNYPDIAALVSKTIKRQKETSAFERELKDIAREAELKKWAMLRQLADRVQTLH